MKKIAWNYIMIGIFFTSSALLLYEINNLDSQYGELIDDGILELKIIQRMSYNSNRRHILLYSIIHEQDSGRSAKLIQEWKDIRLANTRLYDSILNLNRGVDVQERLIEDVQAARKKYNDFCDHIISSLHAKKSQEPQLDAIEFDKFFTDYQEKINSLFLNKHAIMSMSRDKLSSEAESTMKRILLFAVSPVITISILLIMAYVLLKVLHLFSLKNH